MRETASTADGLLNFCNLVCQVEGLGFYQQAAAFLANYFLAQRAQFFLLDVTGRSLVLMGDCLPGNTLGTMGPRSVAIQTNPRIPCPFSQCVFTKDTVRVAGSGSGYDDRHLPLEDDSAGRSVIALIPLLKPDQNLLGVVVLCIDRAASVDTVSPRARLALAGLGALVEIRQTKDRVLQERAALARSLVKSDTDRATFAKRADIALQENLPGQSRAMKSLRRRIGELAGRDEPLVITSQQGALVEVIARALHQGSDLRTGKFVCLTTAGMSGERFSLELFGHMRGAVPGVASARKGALREAAYGTLLINRADLLDNDGRVLLLRLLETRTYRAFGSERELDLATRVVIGANADFLNTLRPGTSGAGLHPLLSRSVLSVPPLAQSPQDATDILLAEHAQKVRQQGNDGGYHLNVTPQMAAFLTEIADRHDRASMAIFVRSALALADDACEPLSITHLLQVAEPTAPRSFSEQNTATSLSSAVASFERSLIERTLSAAGGNRAVAAEELCVPKRTFADKCRKYGL